MAEVTLDSVTKTYRGDVVAVRELSLRVADGELLVIAGPSGCGKTTTLRLVAGLERPTRGAIRIDGRDVTRRPPGERDVAMVFQNYALYPHLTVRANLAFAARVRRVPGDEIRRRVETVAAGLDLAHLLDRRPAALSGGEQQRAALGRVMVRRPGCALFDEPLSNLDAGLRHRLRAEIAALPRQTGTTTLYVTHDQEEALALGDTLAVLHEGALQQIGPPLEVYRRPANRFVAAFLGSPPMNLVTGRLDGAPGALVFDDGRGLRVALDGRAAAPSGAEVVLGVRPDHLRPAADGIDLTVTSVQPCGERVDVAGTTAGGTRLLARVDADTRVGAGARLTVAVDPARVHLFDGGTEGRRLEG